jgi:hypothetical protein
MLKKCYLGVLEILYHKIRQLKTIQLYNSSLAQLVERKTVNLEANSSTLLGRVLSIFLFFLRRRMMGTKKNVSLPFDPATDSSLAVSIGRTTYVLSTVSTRLPHKAGDLPDYIIGGKKVPSSAIITKQFKKFVTATSTSM